MSPAQYRAFKKSGESHAFQRLICNRDCRNLNFNKIAGRALFLMASRKGKDKKTFIERQGLTEMYESWLDKQPVAKFTGYVYELMDTVTKNMYGMKQFQEKTFNKQFEGLVAKAKADEGGIVGNVWCALDTSGSMGARVANTSAYNICISLGIFFSALNTVAFKDHVIMFDNDSTMLKLKGSFVDKIRQIRKQSTAWGGTNFQSVIDEIVRIRKNNPNIPVSDFPETLLVVSDFQFNPTGTNKTNYEQAMKKLRAVGLPEINVIWWQVTDRTKDVPSRFDDKGTTILSGFDGSVITLILGGEEVIDKETGEKRKLNPIESMMIALNQELLRYAQV